MKILVIFTWISTDHHNCLAWQTRKGGLRPPFFINLIIILVSYMWYFLISVLVLAVLLFFPLSKLIWVLSVRRLQRKLNRELDAAELAGQMTRARFISIFVSLIFSYLFNYKVIGI